MATIIKDLGAVSAYAYAVEKGYTGTEEEFAELMASYADVGQTAVTAAQTATAKASEAATSATTATNKATEATTAATIAATKATEASTSASNAATSASTAGSKASEASASATTASTKASEASASATSANTAKTDAVAAKTAAETAQTAAETAQEAAEDAAESVSASAAQIATNAANIAELQSEVSALPTDGVVANSKQLLSENGTDNTEPYMFRAVPVNADRAELDAVVGGTVAWNQQFTNNINELRAIYGTLSASNNEIIYTVKSIGANYFENQVTNHINASPHPFTIPSNHVIFLTCETYAPYSNGFYMSVRNNQVGQSGIGFSNVQLTPNTWNKLSKVAKTTATFTDVGFYWSMNTNYQVDDFVKLRNVMVIDLTTLFGSTIADYIYSLETATTGAGVAFFRKLFPKDYYPYDAGTLKSVEDVSAKVTKDADNNVLGTYPLDSSLTLRGIPKLADGKLSYDGDRYLPDGTVQRRYGVVDLGTLEWFNQGNYFYSITDIAPAIGTRNWVCTAFTQIPSNVSWTAMEIGMAGFGGRQFRAKHSTTSAADFKAAMSGVYLVYELATPTTETATPYQSLQVCDPNGTEEFVTTGIVPVGHETFYLENLRAKIEGLPWDFSSLIAPTEKTTTASRNYTTGALLIMNNVLYKATANIANGGTITVGTNVTATTLSEVISALQ